MGKEHMKMLAGWIDRVVAKPTDESLLAKVASEVKELCDQFPAPGIRV
jgi:glycine hydroxymethyltransferase